MSADPFAIAATILKDCRADVASAVIEMEDGDINEAGRLMRALYNRLGALVVLMETEVERARRASA